MTDIHSHILFDVDDGCSTLKESIELLKKYNYNIVDKLF